MKDYAIEAADGSGWKEVLKITGNYERRRVHRIDNVSTDRIRVQVFRFAGDGSRSKHLTSCVQLEEFREIGMDALLRDDIV